MVYTVTLNPALDYVLQVSNLRFDNISRADAVHIRYGGKGINVSAVLGALDIETTALGFAAGFTGKKLVQLLQAAGIQHDFLFLADGDTRINVKVTGQQELTVNANGPAATEKDLEQLSAMLKTVQSGDYVVLSGAVPSALPTTAYEQILRRLAGSSVRFAVDAEGELLLRTLPHHPFLIKPNHLELGALFGVTTDADETIIRCAKELQQRGAVNVLVSRAEKGALLLDADGNVHLIGNAKGTAVNTVGCGDSMVAGFLAGCIRKNDDYDYALRLATACGNATAYSDGLAKKEKIEECLLQLHN